MKKLILLVVLAVVAFGGGLVGMMSFVPKLSPEKAEEAQRLIDSLNTLDSLAMLDSLGLADSLALPDSLRPDPAVLKLAEVEARVASLEDSLRSVRTRLQRSEGRVAVLGQEVDQLEAERQQLLDLKAEAVELSKTLAKLEDNDLGAILSQLDTPLLALLYKESTARNRSRLLAAMPADRAARFVRHVMGEPEDDPPAAPAPTTDGTQP